MSPSAERRLHTLSRERPGGREGEEGSSSPRGFFGLGGAASEVEVTGGVTAEVTGGTEGSDREKQEFITTDTQRHTRTHKDTHTLPVIVTLTSPSTPLCPAGGWPPILTSMKVGGRTLHNGEGGLWVLNREGGNGEESREQVMTEEDEE